MKTRRDRTLPAGTRFARGAEAGSLSRRADWFCRQSRLRPREHAVGSAPRNRASGDPHRVTSSTAPVADMTPGRHKISGIVAGSIPEAQIQPRSRHQISGTSALTMMKAHPYAYPQAQFNSGMSLKFMP